MFTSTFMALSATAVQSAANDWVFLSKAGIWPLEWVKHFPFFVSFFSPLFMPQCREALVRRAPSLLPLICVIPAEWWHSFWCGCPRRSLAQALLWAPGVSSGVCPLQEEPCMHPREQQSSWAQTHSFLGHLRWGWGKGMIVTRGQHLGEGRRRKRQVKPLWVLQRRGEAGVAGGRGWHSCTALFWGRDR